MNLKDFPYKTSFSAEIKCIVSSETDKFLSLASLDNLKFLIPQNFIDNQGIDLLPIAFNACVANRCNKNGDSISTIQAIEICKNFINRPVDLEHKKTDIIGHIINAGYTQFGTDKQLSEDEVKDITDPFNIALAAYIYSAVYDDLSEVIEESADPSSLRYKMVSASWELAFSDYKIVKGNKNLSEATIIEDANESKKLEPFLQANGGKGKDSNGNYIYRLITGEIYPLGIGLTKNPAAEVKGLFIPSISTENNNLDSEANENKTNLIINENNFSNSTKTDVNKIDMKLSTIEDVKALTDDKLKEAFASDSKVSVASQINTVLADELSKISEKVIAERAEKDKAISNASKVAEDLKLIQAELEKIKSDASVKEAQELFNSRMSSIDASYSLEDGDRKIIAKQIKDLDEAGFTAWASDFDVLFAAKKKTAKADDDVDSEAKAKKEKADSEAKAAKDKKDKEDANKMSADEKAKKDKESKTSTARELLDNIKIIEASVIPNTSTSTQTLKEKFAGAFTKDGMVIKKRR